MKTMIEYEYYKSLIGEYINGGRSAERFLAEVGFPTELDLSAGELVKAVSIIAAAADGDVSKLCQLAGLKMSDFARKFQLPYRTVQDWCGGRRNPPEYLPILIGFILVSELRHD